MNKYFKCVKHNGKEENFKIGTIYEMTREKNEDSMTCTDTDWGKGDPYTYNDKNLLEWLKPWYEFEEVTYTDYILQEFVNEKNYNFIKRCGGC